MLPASLRWQPRRGLHHHHHARRARLSVALLENQSGASRAENGGAAHDPSTHDTRPGPLPAFLPLPLALFLPLPVPRPVTLVISSTLSTQRADSSLRVSVSAPAPLMSLPFLDLRPFPPIWHFRSRSGCECQRFSTTQVVGEHRDTHGTRSPLTDLRLGRRLLTGTCMRRA